tara:strand:+ start:1009 stop:2526 length:1518 start_codon:yes stop_codon:yes gene_type:complete
MDTGIDPKESDFDIAARFATLLGSIENLDGEQYALIENERDFGKAMSKHLDEQQLQAENLSQKANNLMGELNSLFRKTEKFHRSFLEERDNLATERELFELDKQDLQLDREEFEAGELKSRMEQNSEFESDRRDFSDAKEIFEREKKGFELERLRIDAEMKSKRLALEVEYQARCAELVDDSSRHQEVSQLAGSNSLRLVVPEQARDEESSYIQAFTLLQEYLESTFGMLPFRTQILSTDRREVNLQNSISWLMLNIHTKQALERLKIRTYGDLLNCTAEDIQRKAGLSDEQLRYLQEKMGYAGISFESITPSVGSPDDPVQWIKSCIRMLGGASNTENKVVQNLEVVDEESIYSTPRASDDLGTTQSEQSTNLSRGSSEIIASTDTRRSSAVRRVYSVSAESWFAAFRLSERLNKFSPEERMLLRDTGELIRAQSSIEDTHADKVIFLYTALHAAMENQASGSETGASGLPASTDNRLGENSSAEMLKRSTIDSPLLSRANLID